ncbi:MAPEG family protein [Neorhizobium sp. NPDC001467]|uniref:MAPEG family protein n=1 Tax=Neorhizobium sp. NPDC001467 TaxID=3390595 RepID=UPI003D04CF63
MTDTTAMFWPMIAHAFLVFILYYLLSSRRVAAVRSGLVKAEQFRENLSEPAGSLLIHNNLKNQFELPMLFHVGVLATFICNADNIGTILIAWIFVLSRYAHSYVHVTSNRLRLRRPLFMVGFAATFLLWAWLAVWLATS